MTRVLGGALRAANAGGQVLLKGWVDRRRDHGGVLFVDLRDRGGVIQVVFNPELQPDAHATADTFRLEYVVEVEGEVRKRPADGVNPKMPTGEVEVVAHLTRVLSKGQDAALPGQRGEQRRGSRPAAVSIPRPAAGADAAQPATASAGQQDHPRLPRRP